MRTNELDIGVWLMKTEGELEAVLAMDATLRALKEHWLVRETIGYLRRTLSRLDVTSRSLFALVDEGSCFAGTLFEIALACDRIYHLALPAGEARAPKIAVSAANFGDYPMASGQSRAWAALLRREAGARSSSKLTSASRSTPTPPSPLASPPAFPTISTGRTRSASRSRNARP